MDICVEALVMFRGVVMMITSTSNQPGLQFALFYYTVSTILTCNNFLCNILLYSC